MYVKCCIPGCASTREDAMLHKFPVCEKRLKKWLQVIPCESIKTKRLSDIAHMQVCHRHFEARFVTPKSRLLKTAYPTLFTESEIMSGTPRNPLDERGEADVLVDHSYARKLHYDHSYCKPASLGSQFQTERINTEIQPSTSGGTNSAPTVHQSNESCHVRAIQPSTSTMMVMDVPASIPHSFEKSFQIMQIPPPISESEKTDAGTTVVHQVKDSCNVKDCRKKKSKIVDSVGDLTPNCRKIYTEYRKSRKLLSFTKRAKRALRFSKESTLEEITEDMNPLAKKIFEMQINNMTKKCKGRRFTLDQKLIALSIFKQGPRSYRFLQKIFILPSEGTLKKMLAKLNVRTGINPQIFNAIKEEVTTWKEEKKYCSIVFDEMALQTGLTYTYKDDIRGFVETTERKNEFADHALVFLIKGVVCKWQQPIAFYLCEGSTSTLDMKKIIKDIVTAVGETGLVPLVLISDQGASFSSALKNLKAETRGEQLRQNKNPDDTVHIGGYDMHVIFDPPHLIKGMRNNFLTKNIKFDNKICTWDDIVEVYKTDCDHAETRLLHKLNDEHVIPEKIKKMKVKNCTRVFSKTMAGALNYTSAFSHYSDGRPVSHTLKNTAEFVSFMDDLFDSVNGTAVFNKKRRGKTLRAAVTEKSIHNTFWKKAIKKLEKIKYIDRNGRESVVPSIKNWISTLKSFIKLSQFLSNKNIKIMRPRYLNSDAIENFFGQVRSHNFRDTNPNCHSFINTFKSLLVTGFIKFHRSSFNCEEDNSSHILKIKNLFDFNDNQPNMIENHIEEEEDNYGDIDESCMDTYPIIQEARRERLKIQSRAYTAGWVIRKVLNQFKCRECKNDLTTTDSTEVHKWINNREYKDMAKRKLTYPAEAMVRLFGTCIEQCNYYLEQNPQEKDIGQHIKNKILSDHGQTIDLKCNRHKNEIIDSLLSIIIKLCINNWCNTINNILNGVDIIRLENKALPAMQKKAFLKCKKKFNKKKA